MKTLKFMLTAVCVFSLNFLFAQQPALKTDSIYVNGECGMCKSRIQKNLKIDGVTAAAWDTETKILAVTYDPTKITNEDIQQRMVAIGHDTNKYRAEDAVYNKLPGCCHYERKAVAKKQ